MPDGESMICLYVPRGTWTFFQKKSAIPFPFTIQTNKTAKDNITMSTQLYVPINGLSLLEMCNQPEAPLGSQWTIL